MFSHTQSLDEQAQKLSTTNIEQNDQPQPDINEVDPQTVQPEPTDSPGEKPIEEPAEMSIEPSPDLIAEAELRGFQRAMALRAEELFNRPTSSSSTFPAPNPDESAASDIVFLSNIRRSIWD